MNTSLTPHTVSDHEDVEEIQRVAYWLWLESGRVQGKELDHWLAAKEIVKHRLVRESQVHHRHSLPHPIPAELPTRAPLTSSKN